jgi:hypothetical protein
MGRWVIRHTARGIEYSEWKPPMPRINDDYLNCPIYLYRSRHEAEEGINIGGSGFLIGVPAETLPGPEGFVYAVTNCHVVEAGSTCIRFNTPDGRFDVIELTINNWSGTRQDDLAIFAMPGSVIGAMSNKAIPRQSLLTPKNAERWKIGAGDEIMVIGRFINREGRQRNTPTARFGFIAQMESEPIEHGDWSRESFLCEVKSIGGFSGSPVFLTPDWNIRAAYGVERPVDSFPPLLGIDWAHIQSFECARDRDGREIENIRYATNTGMMAVVPAWKLEGVLNNPRIRGDRLRVEEEIRKLRNLPTVSPDAAAEASGDLANDESSNHREDFMHLLDEATRTRK